jgi:hypothetical protein
MNKLRNDSVFCKLTPEQIEQLEDWLFEDKLGYKEVLEKIEKEFGVKGSQSGLSRFYQRLALERSELGLVEMVGACVQATGLAQPPGVLQAGLLTLAYKCAVEFLVKSPEKIREFTALLKALTAAQALEMKRIEFQREEDRIKEEKLEKERKAVEMEEYNQRCKVEREEEAKRREERRRAKLAVKAAEQGQQKSGAVELKVVAQAGEAQPAGEVAEWGVLSREQREYANNSTAKEAVKPLNPA